MVIVDILYLSCLLWFNAGVLRYKGIINSTYLLLLFIVGTFLFAVIRRKIEKRSIVESGIGWGILFFCTIIVTSFTRYGGLESETAEILYAIMILSISLYLKKRPRCVQRVFVIALMIDSILININTLVLLSINADIGRIFASGSDAVSERGLSYFLLGGYGYIYTLVFSVIYIFCCYEKFMTCSRLYKGIIAIYTVSSIFAVIKASYTIGIIFMLLGCILAFVTKNGVKVKTVLLCTFLCFGGLEIVKVLLPILIDSGILGNMVTNRLGEIMFALNGNVESTNDLALRLELYTKTITKLPSIILTGVYEKAQQGRQMLGMHTEWIDRLALFGIIRYSFFVCFLIKSVKYCIRGIREHLFAVFFCFGLIGIINPIITKDVFLLFYILIPFMFDRDWGGREYCESTSY